MTRNPALPLREFVSDVVCKSFEFSYRSSAVRNLQFSSFLFVKLHQTEMDGPDLVKLFVGIGLSEIKAKETAKNSNVSTNLKSCIDAVSKV